MSNRTGGTGCGWFLGIVAVIAAVWSLGISGGVALDSMASGADLGALTDTSDVAGLLFIVALIALGMAKRERR